MISVFEAPGGLALFMFGVRLLSTGIEKPAAQTVAFKIGDFCFLFIALGFVLIEFAPRRGWREYGEIILGLRNLERISDHADNLGISVMRI